MRNICKWLLAVILIVMVLPVIAHAQYDFYHIAVLEDSAGTAVWNLTDATDTDTAATYYNTAIFDEDKLAVEIRFDTAYTHADSCVATLYMFECYQYPDSALGVYWSLSDSVKVATSKICTVESLTMQGGQYITFTLAGVTATDATAKVYVTLMARIPDFKGD